MKATYINDIQKIVFTKGEPAEVLRSVVRSGYRALRLHREHLDNVLTISSGVLPPPITSGRA